MDNQDNTPIAPSENKRTQWSGKTIKIFVEALAKYKRLLTPYAGKDNARVQKEIKQIGRLMSHFREKLGEAQDDYDFVEINFLGSTYGLLSDVMHKHWAILKSQLKRKKGISRVEGALEGEEMEVKKITEILHNPFWQRVTRVKTLVPDFSEPGNVKSASGDKQPSTIKQQISKGEITKTLAFIRSKKLKGVIARDLYEAQLCMDCSYKSVVVLCGGAVEAMLIYKLLQGKRKINAITQFKKQYPKAKNSRNISSWSFEQLINIAEQVKLIDKGVRSNLHAIRNFRNFVHPYREIKSTSSPDKHLAAIAFESAMHLAGLNK